MPIDQTTISDEALAAFISARTGTAAHIISREPIFGGWNSTMSKVVADLGGGPGAMVIRGDLPAAERVVTTDFRAEWELLCALGEERPRVAPRVHFADLTGEQLGRPAMLTEFVEGTSLQVAVLTGAPETHDAFLDGLAALAARIHAVALDALPPSLDVPVGWDEYIDGRLEDWHEAESHWVQASPEMRYVAAWLDANRPPPGPLALVHGDFHTSNTLVESGGEQIAVDWEFAHVGDPREDLGWTMVYESVAPPSLVTERQERFCGAYRQRTGLGADVVNPRTLAWFSLLNVALVVRAMTPALNDVISGANRSLTTGMAVVMGVTHSGHCLRVIEALEASS